MKRPTDPRPFGRFNPAASRQFRCRSACRGAWAAFSLCWLSVAGAAGNEAGEDRPDSKWCVTGQVLAPSGAGVSGADVRVEMGGSAASPGPVLGTAVSGPAGVFRIPLPGEPKERLYVRATKTGYAPFYTAVEFDPDDPEAFVAVELQGARMLRGRVLADKTGEPVVGAEVELAVAAQFRSARSGDDGRFEIAHVTADHGWLAAHHEAYASTRRSIDISEEDDEIEIRLVQARPVRLRVMNDRNEPVVDAEVSVKWSMGERTVRTDADGNAAVPAVAPFERTLFVTMTHPDHVPPSDGGQRVELLAPKGGSPTTRPFARTLRMIRGGTLSGQVVHSGTGRPVSSARVMLGESFDYGMPTKWTDSEGRFLMRPVRPGPSLVTVHHADFAPAIAEVQVEPDRPSEVIVAMETGQPIAGIVLSHEGKPLAGVEATAIRWRNHDTIGLRVLTDATGAFRLDHAPEGPIDFRFTDAETGASGFAILRAGQTDCRITLDKPPVKRPVDLRLTRPAASVAVGQPAPDLFVVTLDRETVRLKDLKGKYVFVDIWATWCGPCVAEMPALKKLRAATADRDDFLMLGISLDGDPATVRDFLAKHRVDWPIAAGPRSNAQKAADSVGVRYIPFNFLVAPDGTVVAAEMHGDDLPAKVLEHLRTPTSMPK